MVITERHHYEFWEIFFKFFLFPVFYCLLTEYYDGGNLYARVIEQVVKISKSQVNRIIQKIYGRSYSCRLVGGKEIWEAQIKRRFINCLPGLNEKKLLGYALGLKRVHKGLHAEI